MAAILLIIGAGIAALYVIAQAEGVDVGAQISDLGQTVTSEFSSIADSVTGGGDDPVLLALPIIKAFEGFSATAYFDPAGQTLKRSIGYGHQIVPGDPYDASSVISEDEASTLLAQDVRTRFYPCVQNSVNVDLTPNQAAALLSLCYNIGCGAFSSSTLVSLLNQGDIEGAAEQFSVWNQANHQVSAALVDRRSQEQELFNS